MNEHLISSSEEVITYQDLDVSSATSQHLETQDLSFTFEYSWHDENLAYHQEYVGENSKFDITFRRPRLKKDFF